jgi:glycosyltransferase involved in cell wall biosynthesis
MRIAQLAPTYERVPPRTYGGTELIVHLITEELVARGHDVTLFASGDSLTRATLRSVTDAPMRYGIPDDSGLGHAEYLQLANAQAAFRAAAEGSFDLVHNHAGIEGLVLAADSRTPVISTMHNPFAPQTRPIWDAYPWFHHAVSMASAATFPMRGALPAIHHGIDVGSFAFEPSPPNGYLLFLGRFSKGKGADRAVEAARRAGRRLILAGKIDAADADHVRATIEPLFDDDQIRYIGEVDGAVKRDLLAGADALLFPIEWDEPFGLVMVEALSSGDRLPTGERARGGRGRSNRVRRRRSRRDGRGNREDRHHRPAHLPLGRGGTVHRPPDGRRRRGDVSLGAGPGRCRVRRRPALALGGIACRPLGGIACSRTAGTVVEGDVP